MKIAAPFLAGFTLLILLSAGPPTGPLQRYEPRVYELKYEVTISSEIPYDPQLQPLPKRRYAPIHRQRLNLSDAPIVMPLIFEGSYSQVKRDSLRAELWLQDQRDWNLDKNSRLDDGYPYGTHAAVLPIVEFNGSLIRWNVAFRQQSFASRIDDQWAANIAWPRQWPEEVADGLKPQMFIESDDELFKRAVEHVAQGNLRMTPPYLAAKYLIRYCIEQVQVTGNGLRRGRAGILHGLDLIGAKRAAEQGRGGPHDLVCVCVAILRAAGIPARPVIGVEEDERGREEFVTWAEFYLPRAGWVPFDPAEMRGKAISNRDVRQPWPEFGTMDDLNRRIPLAYHFIPPKSVQSPQYPAVWGWDPRPNGAPGSTEQMISIHISSLGMGVDDPR